MKRENSIIIRRLKCKEFTSRLVKEIDFKGKIA